MATKNRGSIPTYPDEKIPDRWTPDACGEQALKDLHDKRLLWLWEKREGYKKTLEALVKFWASDELTSEGHRSMWNIIKYNLDLRDKRAREQREQEEARQQALRAVEPPPVTPAPPVASVWIAFDPSLPAAYIAQGWGLRSGASIDRLARDHADFPPPLPRADRRTAFRSGKACEAWGDRHQDVLIKLRERGDAVKARKTKTT